MANAGGAWDNAKKIVEVDLRQKGTDLHAATVVGDTVGDPFKDTSSVAMNPVIKFTTLFGLLAVEIAVTMTNTTAKHMIGTVFFLLALACLIYRRAPLLFLDEPTNHLDVASRESLEQALADYPGTLALVSHDRRLVERVATDIVYLEAGTATVFDSFRSFEERIAETETTRRSGAPASRTPGRAEGLSKNRREQLLGRSRELEAEIAVAEQELHELEKAFASPPEDFAWDRAHQRHTELAGLREALYESLAEVLENAGVSGDASQLPTGPGGLSR
jgi:energy-coupling factor transporter ATP-binding protein EcfA2